MLGLDIISSSLIILEVHVTVLNINLITDIVLLSAINVELNSFHDNCQLFSKTLPNILRFRILLCVLIFNFNENKSI